MTKTNSTLGPPSAAERRRHDRISFPVWVQIISHGILGDNSAYGMCTDISEDGVAFETEATLFLQVWATLYSRLRTKSFSVVPRGYCIELGIDLAPTSASQKRGLVFRIY
jgi:hypothetical protein